MTFFSFALDGSNGPPGLKVGSTIQFYVNDICRSVVSYAVAKTHAINRPDIEVQFFMSRN